MSTALRVECDPANAHLCTSCRREAPAGDELDSIRTVYCQIITKILQTNESPSLDEIDPMRRCLSASLVEVQSDRAGEGVSGAFEVEKEDDCPRRSSYTYFPFALILPHSLNTTFRDSLDTSCIQWVLSHVCAQWRLIAIDLSSLLWSQIHVNIDSDEKFGGRAMLLSLHIRRAVSAPLSLYVMDTEKEWPGYRTTVTPGPLLGTLFQHADRWESLMLSMNIGRAHALFSGVKPPMPALRILRIINHSTMILPLRDVFRNTPTLVDVTLVNCLPMHFIGMRFDLFTTLGVSFWGCYSPSLMC
uniref:F-box domain-containing protein n=1 Tax=Moniliophthora roreri TaxID=221103 RepID=A0A0W0FRQ6_MONRR